jgi:hypothetical protein
MAKWRGLGRAWDWSARSECIGSVGVCGADQLG